MFQEIPVSDVKNEHFNNSALASNKYSRQTELEESIIDKANFAAISTHARLTHEQVFGDLRRKIHAE